MQEKLEAVSVEGIERNLKYFESLVSGSEKLIRPWKVAAIALIVGWILTVAGFLLYLNQYDFVSSNEATGVYAMIDSDGNIISQDITEEQWESFTKWYELNGNSSTNKN